jgi:hypothetical protein
LRVAFSLGRSPMRRARVPGRSLLPVAVLLAGMSPAVAYDVDAAAKSFGAAKLQSPVPAAVLRGWEGSDSAVRARRVERIVDLASWNELWRSHAPGTAVPVVDFDKEMVIAAFAGKVDDSAVRIPLYSVSESDSLEVTTMNFISDVLPSGISAPYLIAVLPLATKPVIVISRSYALMRAPQTRLEVVAEFPALTPANFVQRGDRRRTQGDFEGAVADYGLALRLDPDFAWAYDRRATLWLDRGDYQRAIADFDQAIRVDPKSGPYFNSRCWAILVSGGDAQKALGDCDRSLQLRPGDPETLDSRGFVYLRLGRLDAALADYDTALAGNAKLPSSLFGRGLVRLRKGEATAGNADIQAAKLQQSNIAEEFARYGFKAE